MDTVIKENAVLKAENNRLKNMLDDTRNDMHASLSAISHELRNSLTLIIGSIQLIEQDYPEIKNSRPWSGIRSDLAHMEAFLHDLTSFKSIQFTNLDCKLFDLTAFLHDITRNCQPWFDGTAQKLILSCPDTPSILYGDISKLYLALTNLIKNGLEALDGEGTVSVCLMKKASNTGMTVIQIKDSGIGMNKKQLSNIFKPFYTSKDSGTGLGLPIVKNIIEAHHGQLEIQSHPGKGSVFTILLPRLPDILK